MSIFISIIIFGLIVIVHELGHFIAAKKNGITVEEFAIGMGPKIFSFKKNGTVYSLRCIPIGGFCQMLGGENQEDTSENSFNSKKVWQRIIVVSAGILMNFLLAFIIFAYLIAKNGVSLPVVKKTIANSPAAKAGLETGDIIKEVNQHKINSSQDLSFWIADSRGKTMNLAIKRNGDLCNFYVTPEKDKSGQYFIGIEKDIRLGLFDSKKDRQKNSLEYQYKKINLFEIISNAFFSILFYIKLTFIGLWRLINLNLSLKDMSGPIGIVKTIGDTYNLSATYGIGYAIQAMADFTAILSTNIAIFNFLPLPALDGGRLFFLIIEFLRKKPVSAKYESLIHFVGFLFLMVFAIVVAANDIIKMI